MNPASASHALRHLIRCGTVLKVGELQSKAGRKREVLRLNPDAGYFVAVDLEASPIRFALTDLTGEIRCRWEEDVAPERELDVAKIVRASKWCPAICPPGISPAFWRLGSRGLE